VSVAAQTAQPRSNGRAHTAILAATEQLLQDGPFNHLSVSEIIAAAGVSRTSFYAHFSSKTAVVAECLRRVMDQVTGAAEPFHSHSGEDAEASIRLSLRQWVEVCKSHGALLRAVSEEWPHDEQLRRQWFSMIDAVTAGTAKVVRGARAGGQAPPGADDRALAACLMWGYERVLHVTLAGGFPGLPGPDAIVEPLTQMMIGGLFGRPPATPTA
jgi:TetR/AcrR family transcriptional regulator, ethionamide resistance regulator